MSIRVLRVALASALPILLYLAAPVLTTEPEAATSEAEPGEALRLLDVLNIFWQPQETRGADIDVAIQQLAQMGDDVIGPLMNGFEQIGDARPFQDRAIRVLEAIGSGKARQVLLDIALGRTAPVPEHIRSAAARAYVKATRDTAQTKALLVSRETPVLTEALAALRGQPIDGRLLKRLEELAMSRDLQLRWAALSVMADDPGTVHAREKAELILAAIREAESVPKASGSYWESHYTMGELTYLRCIRTLAMMRAPTALLKEMSAPLLGKARYCMVLARAERGDVTIRDDLHKILHDPEAGVMRAWAAQRLGYIGATEDIELLQKTAESDPLVRERGWFYGPPLNEEEFFPVREAAHNAVMRLSCGRKAAGQSVAQLRREEDDIREAVFRYQFEHNASAQPQDAAAYFLSLDPHESGFLFNEDPTDDVMRRFEGHKPPCKKVSECSSHRFEGVRDRETGEEGLIFTVGNIRWINEDEVEVSGGYYAGSLSASGNIYSVVREGDRWIVKKDKRLWSAGVCPYGGQRSFMADLRCS